jgi:hypothetical protein
MGVIEVLLGRLAFSRITEARGSHLAFARSLPVALAPAIVYTGRRSDGRLRAGRGQVMLQLWESWLTIFVGSIGLIPILLGITGLGSLKERPVSRLQQLFAGGALLGAIPMLLNTSLFSTAGWAGALVVICGSFLVAYVGVFAIFSANLHGGHNIISFAPYWLSGTVQREAQSNAAGRTQAQARREARRQARAAWRQA